MKAFAQAVFDTASIFIQLHLIPPTILDGI